MTRKVKTRKGEDKKGEDKKGEDDERWRRKTERREGREKIMALSFRYKYLYMVTMSPTSPLYIEILCQFCREVACLLFPAHSQFFTKFSKLEVSCEVVQGSRVCFYLRWFYVFTLETTSPWKPPFSLLSSLLVLFSSVSLFWEARQYQHSKKCVSIVSLQEHDIMSTTFEVNQRLQHKLESQRKLQMCTHV